jgi:hypothetical protein
MAVALLTAVGGCDEDGPAVEANPQVVSFPGVDAPAADQTTVVLSARASSGLPVRYSSLTPTLCSVDARTGVVTGLASGTCTIAANQSGDERYAPAPQVTQDVVFTLTQETLVFAQVPSLGVYDRGTVVAIDSTGAAVTYQGLTPLTCTVDSASGLVDALAPGACSVVASAGALQVVQTILVREASDATVPGAPTGIRVTAGDALGTAVVYVGATVGGGTPILGYSVVSSPGGVAASGRTSPVVVTCPSSCAGLAFSVSTVNAMGTSLPSDLVPMVTDYRVVAIFREPDTQPNDTIFVGTFTLNATTATVSGLRGVLSESMTGGTTPYPHDTMTWLPLEHQLSSLPVTLDGASGLLVTTFLLSTTDTLSSSASFGGSDGFSPGTGTGLHFGYPGPNPGNAYARIFVDVANPTAEPTQAQLDKLAYADCTPGGMMGDSCMTGTSMAGYGSVGTMSGYPVSQTTIVKR